MNASGQYLKYDSVRRHRASSHVVRPMPTVSCSGPQTSATRVLDAVIMPLSSPIKNLGQDGSGEIKLNNLPVANGSGHRHNIALGRAVSLTQLKLTLQFGRTLDFCRGLQALALDVEISVTLFASRDRYEKHSSCT